VIAAAHDGTLGVTYYDTRQDVPGDVPYVAESWFAHSDDRGDTWSETSLRGRFDLRSTLLRRIPVRGRFVGDYAGLAALPRGFGAAFALGRPRAATSPSDIFFRSIRTTRRGGWLPA
jgi:hypothetical protein